MIILFIAGVAIAGAGFTWVVGWWGVAVVALLAGGLYSGDSGASWSAALGAMLGWGILFALDAITGPFARAVATIGGAMSIPGPALLVVTLLFAGLLGWSASTIAVEVKRLILP